MKPEYPPWRFPTIAARAGWHRKQLDVVMTVAPIVQSVTYLHPMHDLDAIFGGEQEGFVYTRYGNPTVAALEEAVAQLEGGAAAVGFATGMAAVHAALLSIGLKSGDVVVCSQDVSRDVQFVRNALHSPRRKWSSLTWKT
jgi:O-acetylhomoserine/O-acetylserine sulfhydrylase-like pyridoxal-dependent enzyme